MIPFNTDVWRRFGIVFAIAAAVLIGAEHFLSHGMDMNPRDHWISEYALSLSPIGRGLMVSAFCSLALSALSVAVVVGIPVIRALFGLAGGLSERWHSSLPIAMTDGTLA